MMALTQFIYRNTFMGNALTALIKTAIILISLSVGVLSYELWQIDFIKSLFLYSSALTLDMSLKYIDLKKAPTNQMLLKIVAALILFVTITLWGFSTIGLFQSELVKKLPIISNCTIVKISILVQPIWYGIETIVLFIADLICPADKEQLAISNHCESKYKQKNNI